MMEWMNERVKMVENSKNKVEEESRGKNRQHNMLSILWSKDSKGIEEPLIDLSIFWGT
jgi:hypothetical protein